MPDNPMAAELLASRYARALEASRERADKEIATRLGWRLAVVRLEASGHDGHWHPIGERGPDLDEAVRVFAVDDVRYLGAGERVVQLIDTDHVEELALKGHLQRIVRAADRDFRMVAL